MGVADTTVLFCVPAAISDAATKVSIPEMKSVCASVRVKGRNKGKI